MSIAIDCPSCGSSLEVAERLAGTTGQCPKCAAKIRIPADIRPPEPDASRRTLALVREQFPQDEKGNLAWIADRVDDLTRRASQLSLARAQARFPGTVSLRGFVDFEDALAESLTQCLKTEIDAYVSQLTKEDVVTEADLPKGKEKSH
jgi:hypothetical protein